MKRLCEIILVIMLVVCFSTSALAVEILPKDEEYVAPKVEEEPIVTPEPKAVLVETEREDLIENDLLEDQGTVWVDWNGTAYSNYGCTTASINYTNPTRSNIGVTFTVGIFDSKLLEYFGTTFRPEEEVLELALNGFYALRNGVSINSARKLAEKNELFIGMNPEDINVEPTKLIKLLGEKGFLNMTEEELGNITEDDVRLMSESDKLLLAELGGYDPTAWYMVIGEAGVINPGYALYEIELYTFPGKITLPKGEYEIVYVLNGYDAKNNRLSDFIVHLPVTLIIEEDLPKELQLEYGVSLAESL